MLCRRQAKRQKVATNTPLQPMTMLGQVQAAYTPPSQPYHPPTTQYQPPLEMQYQQPGMAGLAISMNIAPRPLFQPIYPRGKKYKPCTVTMHQGS